MKVINIREARAGLSELVDDAQKEPICLTRHGKPVAILTGVEGAELEAVILEHSKEFWDEIERRRTSGRPRRTIEEVRERLRQKDAPVSRPALDTLVAQASQEAPTPGHTAAGNKVDVIPITRPLADQAKPPQRTSSRTERRATDVQ